MAIREHGLYANNHRCLIYISFAYLPFTWCFFLLLTFTWLMRRVLRLRHYSNVNTCSFIQRAAHEDDMYANEHSCLIYISFAYFPLSECFYALTFAWSMLIMQRLQHLFQKFIFYDLQGKCCQFCTEQIHFKQMLVNTNCAYNTLSCVRYI